MTKQSAQAPRAVVMIRPRHFMPNPATAVDNAFQVAASMDARTDLSTRAYAEVSAAASRLTDAGVDVHLFEDETADKPDSVFPNNWFSTHAGGHVAVYPMYSESRRKERRSDVIEFLKRVYRVQDVIDYSGLEPDGIFLEGTGAMVLDHIEHVAYAVKSNRTSPIALERFCTHFRYEPMVFDAVDAQGRPVYHTNVLMCIGTDFALAAIGMIPDVQRRAEIAERLTANGRDLIELSERQIGEFAGNAIELQGATGRILALSQRAHRALSPDQIARIERTAKIVPLDVQTIEKAGGSVRCMLAGVHLSRRTTPCVACDDARPAAPRSNG